ncbi:MAG: sugar phosphate isomerase/epimerase, partial [Bacteroidota bacterium]|nr:sugar phosphate isomerase/epimerase [Bacteroidota bacterium]
MKKIYNRRAFIGTAGVTMAGLGIAPQLLKAAEGPAGYPVRLGGPVFGKINDTGEWIQELKSLGYSAAYCPLQPGATEEAIRSFRQEAEKNNIIIAEAGVWNNMLDPDEEKRKAAIEKNIEVLRLADEIGARCCVNISGARGEIWDG